MRNHCRIHQTVKRNTESGRQPVVRKAGETIEKAWNAYDSMPRYVKAAMGTAGYIVYAASGAGGIAAAAGAAVSLMSGGGSGAIEYAFKSIQTREWSNSEFGKYVSNGALNMYGLDGMFKGIGGAIKIAKNSPRVRSFLRDETGSVCYKTRVVDIL